jgi:signal transduction histidine kinase
VDLRSLRGQLGLFYAAALLLALVVFAGVTIAVEHQLRSANFDDRIETATRALIAITDERNRRLIAVGTDKVRFARILGTRLNGAIVATDGATVMRSVASLPPEIRALASAPPNATTLRTILIGRTPYRVGITPVPRPDDRLGVAVVWQNFDRIAAIDRQLVTVFAFGIPLVVAFALVAGNLVAARGLARLRSLAEIASAIEAHDLSRRLTVPPTRDELGLLCTTFNRMLDRLQDAFARQRRFTSDASHELRAPLSVILAEADLTLRRRRAPEEYERALRAISSQVGRLEALTRDLLAEARAEYGRAGEIEPIPLDELVRTVAGELELLARQRSVTMEVETLPIVVQSSRDELQRAVLCVAHNALKFARSRVEIAIRHDAPSGTAIVSVTDDGPGFSDAALDHATERFWRDPKVRAAAPVADFAGSGTGLGLAIANGIVAAARGELRIANCVSSTGAIVTILLPADDHVASG